MCKKYGEKMKVNRNLTIFAILLAVSCLMLVSQASATEFSGSSLSDLDNSIKTSDDGNIKLTDDLNLDKGTINIDKPVTIDGNGNTINLASNQDNTFLNVYDDVTLKNLTLSGGNLGNSNGFSLINVVGSGKLTLENVVIKDANLGDVPDNAYFFNSGNIVFRNSTVTDISGSYGNIIKCTANYSPVLFENSCYKDSVVCFSSGWGVYTIKNSEFLNLTSVGTNMVLFDYIQEGLNIESSLFKGIYGYNEFLCAGIEFEGKILNSVFLDTIPIVTNETLRYDGSGLTTIENNYFGTNTPFEDGLILERVKDNCIMLNISLCIW